MMSADSHDGLRAEVRAWVDTTWRDDLTVREWWSALAAAGWSQPTWPSGLGGRDLNTAQARAVGEELAAQGVIAPPAGIGVKLAAPTLLAHGTARQIERYLPRVADGTESWCQLFSEPGSGSDLPSLSTRAVRADNGWRASGQKVWSSNADRAQYALLLARRTSMLRSTKASHTSRWTWISPASRFVRCGR
jgi:alkylation response protein AidB-like acyl-CoA dehydrogenase